MSEQTYEFKVNMACGGCSGAVNRVLKKLDGVKTIDISLETQTVKVVTEPEVPYDTVYKTIHKTGKTIVSGSGGVPADLVAA
ncbi:Cytosolic copper metallochaperone [Rhizina undulata]